MLCTFLGKLKQSSNNYSTLILLCNIGKYFIFRFHLDHTGNTDVFITLFMSQYQKMKTCDLGRSRDSLLLAMGISILSIDKQSDNYQNIVIQRNQLYFFKIMKSKAELSLLQETYKVCKSKNLWFLSLR